MHNALKKLFSLLLVLVLAFGMLPVTAHAAENTNITGTWETEVRFPASDLDVQANDITYHFQITFHEDGTVTTAWEALDLSALRLYFHQMFISAYYYCAYGSGISDPAEVERLCWQSTGMTVSDYILSFLDSFNMEALFTPTGEFGFYKVEGSDLYLELTLMGNPSDSTLPNPLVRIGNSLQITLSGYDLGDPVLRLQGVNVSSQETVSTSPQVVDLTYKLNVFMWENAAYLESYLEDLGYIKAALFYHAMVTDGGQWDIKRTEEWRFEPGKTYVYQGRVLRMDDPGNIHFGYLGAILFPEEFVCFGAGMNNLLKFGFDQGDLASYYDDPQDQEMMRWGYRMYMQQRGNS